MEGLCAVPPGTLVGGVTSILSVVVSLLLSPSQNQVQYHSGFRPGSGSARRACPQDPVRGEP